MFLLVLAKDEHLTHNTLESLEDFLHPFLEVLWGGRDSKGEFVKAESAIGMKVVNSCDFSASGICQNLEFASSLLNTLAPDSWARIW